MSKPTTSKGTVARTVYAARRRDGTYRWVEAVSWKDAKRYFGSDAVSIRKRVISVEDYHDSIFDQASQRDIYELGYIRPENHGPLRPGRDRVNRESTYTSRLHRAAPALLALAREHAAQLAASIAMIPCTGPGGVTPCISCELRVDLNRITALIDDVEGPR